MYDLFFPGLRRKLQRVVLLSVFLFVATVVVAVSSDVFAASAPVARRDTRSAGLVPQSTRVVTNTDDSGAGSLRQAIRDANSGDDITFAPIVAGVITLTTGELYISRTLNIDGPGASVLAVSGDSTSTVFDIAAGMVRISGLVIRNGPVNGNAILNSGSLILDGSQIDSNAREPWGG